MDLPIKVLNQPIPPYIKRGDTRGTENIGKWTATTRRGGLLVGLVQNVASPRGPGAVWSREVIRTLRAA